MNRKASISNMQYDRLYIEFLCYYNTARDYFECHEVLEELWLRENKSLLLQGLLQSAVALYHCRNENYNGADKLLTASIHKLSPYPSDSLGIYLDKLILDMRQYRERLARRDSALVGFYDLNILIHDPLLRKRVEMMKLKPPEKAYDDTGGVDDE